MARLGILILALIFIAPLAKAGSLSIVGEWQFTALRYQGKEMPPLNPALFIIYQFDDQGHSRLYWTRKDESGFCERRGLYVASQIQFLDYVIWVNPHNRGDCGKDPDMQIGKSGLNTYRVKDGRFELDLPLGDDILTYIWTPL